jgi:hypothetical protein
MSYNVNQGVAMKDSIHGEMRAPVSYNVNQGTAMKDFLKTPHEERDRIVIGALKECTTKASIEDTFKRYKIKDVGERTDKLNRCMGSPQTFFSSGKISPEDAYELTIQMFLTMSWKLNEIYDRMGLAVASV